MRHDLAKGQDKVVAAARNQPVELGRPSFGMNSFGHLDHIFGRHGADGFDVGPPIVVAKEVGRNRRKHFLAVLGRDLFVRAEGGQHVDEGVAIVVVDHARQLAGAAGSAGIVGRNGEHSAAGPQIVEHAGEGLAKLIGGEFDGGRAEGEVERHRKLTKGERPELRSS